jgi:amino acid adenylation domain-containing protein
MSPADRAGFDLDASLPSRFRQIVRMYGSRVAIETMPGHGPAQDDGQVSYDTLDRSSNQVAHAILARLGRGPGQVAVLLGHGAPIIAAILGILKAGKSYVALNPGRKPEQLAEILEHSEARLLISSPGPLAPQIATTRAGLLMMEEVASFPVTDPGIRVEADSPAYIAYTSGSTGRPKGVIDSHRHVLHNVMRYTTGLGIAPADRLTLLQTCSNSGSISSLFGALLNGATSCPFDVSQSGLDRLAEWLRAAGITIYHSVPAIFRELDRGKGRYDTVRVVRLEGDQAFHRDVAIFRRRFTPPCVLVHGLGATECGLVRCFSIDHQTPFDEWRVPIGYAVDDMDILLRHDAGREVPTGQVGEIVVRSRYLALGYWRDPERTAAAFGPDPSDGSRRLYRTGDLGRFRSDGCLEHLGRRDSQVKVRGNLVDLSEIERAVVETTGALEVVAVGRPADDPGEDRIVAYVVPGAEFPSIGAARRRLAVRLESFMIPSAFVLIDRLPRSPDGKLDRGALPPAGQARRDPDRPFVGPRTVIEARLTRLWADVLGEGAVGVEDDFFELGGHSLQALQIVSAVFDAFRVEVPVDRFFQTPTIAALAGMIAEGVLSQVEGMSDEEARRRLKGDIV